MIALLRVEIRKLGGSLALLLAVAAPALPGALAALALVSTRKSPQWESTLTGFVLPLWALFLMPMVVAAFTTLVAHRVRGWDHLLALPIPRARVFAAKAIVVLAATVGMTLLALVSTWIGASVGGAIGGHAPLGNIPWGKLARLVPMLLAASVALVAIQLWVALRFASFVVPLAVGIGGTLVALAVAMTRTVQADWFPWVLPLKVLTAPDPMPFAIAGGVGGLVVLALMIADLSRRDFAGG